MKNILLGSFISTTFLLISCQVSVGDKQNPESPLAPPTATQPEAAKPEAIKPAELATCKDASLQACPVEIRIVAQPEPNRYQLQALWKSREGRLIFREGPTVLASVDGSKESVTILDVRAGAKMQVTIDQVFPAKGLVDTLTYDLKIPLDLVFVNTAILTGPLLGSFGRVFFMPNARLLTMGNVITVSADQLIAGGGVIENFLPGSVAPMGHGGRSGGHQSWRFKRGLGTLKFFLRGERGGKGQSEGQPFSAANRAASGANGQPATTKVEIRVGYLFSPQFGERNTERVIVCGRHPTNGLPGTDGLAGLPGLRGHDSGNSGSLDFIIDDGKALSIATIAEAVPGGAGGTGCAGQLGGFGGAPGENNKYCQAAGPGAPGLDGPDGAPGGPGNPGELGKMLIQGATLIGP